MILFMNTAIELAKAGSNVSIIDSRSSVGNEITEKLNKNNIELILGRFLIILMEKNQLKILN